MSVVEELEASGEVLPPAVRAAILALEAIAARVPLLEARIRELEARLGQDSTNSSRPPCGRLARVRSSRPTTQPSGRSAAGCIG